MFDLDVFFDLIYTEFLVLWYVTYFEKLWISGRHYFTMAQRWLGKQMMFSDQKKIFGVRFHHI